MYACTRKYMCLWMCAYIYIYTYTCMCICVCVYICIYVTAFLALDLYTTTSSMSESRVFVCLTKYSAYEYVQYGLPYTYKNACMCLFQYMLSYHHTIIHNVHATTPSYTTCMPPHHHTQLACNLLQKTSYNQHFVDLRYKLICMYVFMLVLIHRIKRTYKHTDLARSL